MATPDYGMFVFGDRLRVYGAGQVCPSCPPYIPDVEVEYVPKNEDYRKFNWRDIRYEGLGVNASFTIFGNVTLKEDGELIVTATGSTAAGRMGKITYSVFAIILVDGQEVDRQYITFDKRNSFYPTKVSDDEDFIGNAHFNLPKPKAGKRYELLLEAFYNFGVESDGNKRVTDMKYIIPLSTRMVEK